MSRQRLQFWFEFASSYSYPAAYRLHALLAQPGNIDIEVDWRPFLLGPIFADQGMNDSPFNLYPRKGSYMWRDLERICGKYRLPFRRPSVFPRSGLLAARVACLCSAEPWLSTFVLAVYRANFADDQDIADPQLLAAILNALGQPGDELLAEAQQPPNKLRLREQTERASGLGIFGAPSFIVAEELFWGNDRLEDALAWQGGQG